MISKVQVKVKCNVLSIQLVELREGLCVLFPRWLQLMVCHADILLVSLRFEHT